MVGCTIGLFVPEVQIRILKCRTEGEFIRPIYDSEDGW